jgi:hypothetical protein
MAYVLKYKIEVKGKDKGANDGLIGAMLHNTVFEIEELDPIDNTVTSLLTETGIVINQKADRENKALKFIYSSATVQFLNTETISLEDFNTEDEKKFRGTYKVDGNIVFRGWLVLDYSDEEFNCINPDITLKFSDSLGDTLNNLPYQTVTGGKYWGKATIIEILANINRIIGLELNIVAGTNIKSDTLTTGRINEKQKISQLRFIGKGCKEVLTTLCAFRYGYFFQRDGAFWFVDFNLLKQSNRTVNLYNSLGVYQSDIVLNTVKQIGRNKDIFLGENASLRNFTTPFKRTSIATVYESGNLFENGMLEDYNVGASEPLPISQFVGVGSEQNNISFPSWGAIGIPKISLLTYSDEYMATQKTNWNRSNAPTMFGTFPQNNKIFVLEKNTQIVLFGSKTNLRKGTIINFTLPTTWNLFKNGSVYGAAFSNTGICAYYISVESKAGVKYFLSSKGRWLLPSDSLNGIEFRYIQAKIHAGIIKNSTDFINILNESVDSETCPIDGDLQVTITFPDSADSNYYYQFTSPIVTIKSLPKGIDKIIYETEITGKHTVVDNEEVIPICDNSLELIPCSVFDEAGKESQSYTQGTTVNNHMLLLPLVEKALQFSKRHWRIHLNKAITHNIKLFDIVTFETAYSEFAGKRFLVCDLLNRSYEEAETQIILHEIVENGIINYNIYYYDENGIKQIAQSSTVDTTTPPVVILLAPWTWTNIGNTSGNAQTLFSSFFIGATGNDIWDNTDNLGYLWRPAQNSVLEGNLPIITNDALGTNINDFAKVGIMYRESLNADSAHVSVLRLRNGWVGVAIRNTTAGVTSWIGGVRQDLTTVTKFKLDVSDKPNNVTDKLVTAYYFDGASWVLLQSVTVAFTGKLGFCFAMRGSSAICSVTDFVFGASSVVNPNPCNKPSGTLVPRVIVTRAELVASGNPCNKPSTTLLPRVIVTRASGGTTTTPPPTTPPSGGRTVATRVIREPQFPSKQEFYNPDGTVSATNIDIDETLLDSFIITDKNWANLKGHQFKTWQIGVSGMRNGATNLDPLTNISVTPNMMGRTLSIKVFYWGSVSFTEPYIGSRVGIKESYQTLIQL